MAKTGMQKICGLLSDWEPPPGITLVEVLASFVGGKSDKACYFVSITAYVRDRLWTSCTQYSKAFVEQSAISVHEFIIADLDNACRRAYQENPDRVPEIAAWSNPKIEKSSSG